MKNENPADVYEEVDDDEPGTLAKYGIWVRRKSPAQPYMRLEPYRDKDRGDFVFVCLSDFNQIDPSCMDVDFHFLRDPFGGLWRVDGWECGSVIMSTELVANPRTNKPEWRYPVHKLQPPSTLKAVMVGRVAATKESQKLKQN